MGCQKAQNFFAPRHTDNRWQFVMCVTKLVASFRAIILVFFLFLTPSCGACSSAASRTCPSTSPAAATCSLSCPTWSRPWVPSPAGGVGSPASSHPGANRGPTNRAAGDDGAGTTSTIGPTPVFFPEAASINQPDCRGRERERVGTCVECLPETKTALLCVVCAGGDDGCCRGRSSPSKHRH